MKIQIGFIALIMLLASTALSQDTSRAFLVARCEGERYGCYGYDAMMDRTLDFGLFRDKLDTKAVVRVCSKEPTAIAFVIAAIKPHSALSWVNDIYGIERKNFIYLRSEDCQVMKSGNATTELWAIPESAELPSHVEAVKPANFRINSFGKQDSNSLPFEGSREYRKHLRQLVTSLRTRPNATGIILGYYLKRPTPALRKRLTVAENYLQRSGLAANRYTIRLLSWGGGYDIEPADPEPKYPMILVSEIAKDCGISL